jgi:hypothetical protein
MQPKTEIPFLLCLRTYNQTYVIQKKRRREEDITLFRYIYKYIYIAFTATHHASLILFPSLQVFSITNSTGEPDYRLGSNIQTVERE